MRKSRYVMIGGFLGSGKTSAMIKLGEHLKKQGRSFGLITNDQSVGLVDTARVRNAGFPVQEITGSCFCCNFNGLLRASEVLTSECMPDVIIAEPVGSCTDLKATISHPLAKLHGSEYELAPLSVLVDPQRFGRAMGILKGSSFSEKVLYIYRKQLEEAEVIVINKVDALLPGRRNLLAGIARHRFPHAKVFEVSCQTGEGLQDWFEEILVGHTSIQPAMDVDYDVYAEGEALLGWLNTSVRVLQPAHFNGNEFLLGLTNALRGRLVVLDIEIAHLKMTLIENDGLQLGSISLTHTDAEPQIIDAIGMVSGESELTINLRAEADPGVLRSEVNKLLGECTLPRVIPNEIHAFRPGRPTPTHRMAYC